MEDDASTRVLVSAVLRKEGYDVLAAEDGSQGLALVREHRPDLDALSQLAETPGIAKVWQDKIKQRVRYLMK